MSKGDAALLENELRPLLIPRLQSRLDDGIIHCCKKECLVVPRPCEHYNNPCV